MKNNIEEIRHQFKLFDEYKDIAYLDNAATAQKPECVIRAEMQYYEKYNANPLRGIYSLGEAATKKYEEARESVRKFINADSTQEIIFTRNATEGLNLVAYSLGGSILKPKDEIVISIMEHHSNLLPWQQIAKKTGAQLKYLECEPDGTIDEEKFRSCITNRTKIVAMTHISNVLGCKNDLKKYAQICHENDIIIVADGAQSVAHMPVDVKDMDVDFFAFSGHKMYGPMGIGVLYGKKELLDNMPPFLTGGEMIDFVTRQGAVFSELPHKFEAGTVNAAGAAGLEAAIGFMNEVGFDTIRAQEEKLTTLAMNEMKKIPHINILGSDDPLMHNGIITFTIDDVHPHDVAYILDSDNIAVRAGHHCAQPLLQYLGISAATRVSIAFYNTESDVMRFIESVKTIREKMGYGK